MSRFRFVAATAIALACIAPMTANAQEDMPDAATQAALTTFRANAAELVVRLPDSKGVSSLQIAESYLDGGLAGVPSERLNTIMVVKQAAEAAAWQELAPAERSLIKAFWESQSSAVASVP